MFLSGVFTFTSRSTSIEAAQNPYLMFPTSEPSRPASVNCLFLRKLISFPGSVCGITLCCTLDGLLSRVPWRTLSVVSAGCRPIRWPPPAWTAVFRSHVHLQSFQCSALGPRTSHSGQPEPWAVFSGPSSGVDAGAAVGPSRPTQLRGELRLSRVHSMTACL